MKRILLTLGSLILTIALYAGVVKGNIGQGTFVDYSNESSQAYGIDFDKDGNIEFRISDSGENANCYIDFNPIAGVNILTQGTFDSGSGWDVIKPLTSGANIGSTSLHWGSMGDGMLADYSGTTVFPLNQDAYVGFSFKKSGATHYGYAVVNVSGSATAGFTGTWKECYYETTPNTPITAGVLASIVNSRSEKTTIYPNPTKGDIHIKSASEVTRVEIFNTLGVCVKELTGDESTQTIDMSLLAKGIYIVRIHNGNKMETIHLVKQ